MKPKQSLIWVVAGAIVVFIIAVIWAMGQKPSEVPFVKLTDGSVIILKGVTYGTNHVLGTPAAKVVSRLPPVFKRFAGRVLGAKYAEVQSSTTSEPSLKVWLAHGTPQSGTGAATNQTFASYRAFLASADGFVSGREQWFMPATVWTLDFPAWPRRDEFVYVKIFTGEYNECGSFKVRNPAMKKYPVWRPDPIGTKSADGHLTVELVQLLTGIGSSMTYETRRDGKSGVRWQTNKFNGGNRVGLQFRVSSGDRTNEHWQVSGVTVTDATGNALSNNSLSTGGDYMSASFSPGLWPSESAWRLKIQLKRNTGFATNDLFAFEEVPLPSIGETNVLGWQTNVNGCTVKLKEVRLRENSSDSYSSSDASHANVWHSQLPENTYLDLVEVWFGDKRGETQGWSSSGQERSYVLGKVPAGSKSMRLVFALHLGRTVEFTAKPEIFGTNASD